MIKLYHLDWDRSTEDQERHMSLAMPMAMDEGAIEIYLDAFSDGLYDLVAEIDTDDLNQAYAFTNNGIHSDSWSLEPPAGVVPTDPNAVHGNLGRRSTSVGDILEQDGKFMVVAPIGFLDLGQAPYASTYETGMARK